MNGLRVGSIFSGIGAFDRAFAQAGFEVAWQIENDRDCNRVLARHWSGVRRYGDVTLVDGADLEPVDVIAFGSPCQDLSVAGKRAGLGGQRSGLFFEAVRIIRSVRPTFAVWENVPGTLSSHGGRDFGAALDTLADAGAMDICWCVLDAQWFGVAQRRRRVFLVADFGGERAAEILSVPYGSQRHTPPSRAAGQAVAASLTSGSASPGVSRPGRRSEDDVNLVAGSLTARYGKGVDSDCTDPLVYQCQGSNIGEMGTLRRGNGHVTGGVPFVIASQSWNSQTQRIFGDGDVAPTLSPGSAEVAPFVAYTLTASYGKQVDSSNRNGGPPNLIMPLYYSHDYNQDRIYSAEGIAPAVTSQDSNQSRNVMQGIAVRRLMPVECLRLMALPDDYLDGCNLSDSVKYRLIGNSLVVTEAEWIARRLRRALEVPSSGTHG